MEEGKGRQKVHKDRGLRKTNRRWTRIDADEDELITAALFRVQLMNLQVTPRNVCPRPSTDKLLIRPSLICVYPRSSAVEISFWVSSTLLSAGSRGDEQVVVSSADVVRRLPEGDGAKIFGQRLFLAELCEYPVRDRHPLIDGVTFICQDDEPQVFGRDECNVCSETAG